MVPEQAQPSTDPRPRRPWLLALLGFLLLSTPWVLWRLGANDIVTMEGIVADGAREMARTGDLWVPRLHGEIYTYKPPLAYWLAWLSTGGSTTIDEWSLRLPFALAGLAMAVAILLLVGRRLGPNAGVLCALASIATVLGSQKFRLAEFDAPLAAGVGIATTLAMLELTARHPSGWRWPLAYLALALAFLAKGIPALMFFGPGLLIASGLTGSSRRLLSKAHLAGCLLFVVVVGLWLFGAWSTEGWSAFEQPLREADAKGLTWSPEALAVTLRKPLEMLAVFFPWTLALPLALRKGVRRRWHPEARNLISSAAGFTLGGLLTFMAVPASETRYLLPLAAPIGILCGMLLHQAPLGTGIRGPRAVALGLGGSIALLTPWVITQGHLTVPASHGLVLMVAGILVASSAFALDRLPIPGRHRATLAVLASAFCLWVVQLYASEPHRAHSRSLRGVAADFEPHLDSSETLWVGPVSAGFHHSSLIYYLRRRVQTFDTSRLPPPDSAVVLFSDEPPESQGAPPFDYHLLEEATRRGVRFALVRVETEPGEDRAPGRRGGPQVDGVSAAGSPRTSRRLSSRSAIR